MLKSNLKFSLVPAKKLKMFAVKVFINADIQTLVQLRRFISWTHYHQTTKPDKKPSFPT